MAFFAGPVSLQITTFEKEMAKAWFSSVYDARPGRLRNYLVFFKANPFILGLVLARSIAEQMTENMLMFYLVYVMEKHLFMAAVTVNLFDGLSDLLAFVAAHVADAYTDRFSVIVFSTASYIMGLILLWIAVSSPSEYSLFNVAILLIALGKSGKGSTLQSFLEYQLRQGNNIVRGSQARTKVRRNRHRSEVSAKFLWHIAQIVGYLTAIFFLANDNGGKFLKFLWRFSFQISAMLVLLASFLFFYGNRFYDYENPTKTSLAHVFKVLKAATSNKLHLWASFVLYGVVIATGNTIFIAQTSNLNLNIATKFMLPIPFFFVLKSFTSDIVNFLFWWGDSTEKHITKIRIEAGMICSVICCVTARQVELHRHNIIKKEGLIDDPLKMSSMSGLWLIPQFLLLGLMEGLAGGGLVKHMYGHVPESMRSFAQPFSELVVCVGKFCSIFFMSFCCFWFGQNINVSKVDAYFLVVAVLCCVSFCFYLLWWRNFDDGSVHENTGGTNQEGEQNGDGVQEELNGELGNVQGGVY